MTPLETSLAFTLREEGGFSSDTNDAGNWSSGKAGSGRFVGTMRGIAAPTLIRWVGPENSAMVTEAYMRALQPPLVKAIMIRGYWVEMQCQALHAGVGLMVFDHGINAGPAASIRLLQRAVGTKQDGCCGPKTIAAASRVPAAVLVEQVGLVQVTAYRAMAAFPRYGAAWLGRVGRRRVAALALARSIEPRTGD